MSALGDALDLVLFVGAARAAGTPEQKERLRESVVPILHEYKRGNADEAAIRAAVHAVMGDDWSPGPEWKVKR